MAKQSKGFSADPWTEPSEPEPVATEAQQPIPEAPAPEPAKPISKLWTGGTLSLDSELLQALQAGERRLLESDKPGYILWASGEPEGDLLIAVNSQGAAVFRANSPDVIVPRMLNSDFTAERSQLSSLREKEHFDIGYGLRCLDHRTNLRLSEHHERLAIGIWLVTIVSAS